MELDEFRTGMESYRRAAYANAKAMKEPILALEALGASYIKFNEAERQIANQVFIEWALSGDENLRFDALALIFKFRISTAIGALEELVMRLGASVSPSAPYELKKVHRILEALGTSGTAHAK